MNSFLTRHRGVAASVALAALTLACYWPVLHCEFINYDDNKYVTENPHVQGGLTSGAIRWALTSGYASNWHPLTWISHMADCQIFGLNPRGHHVTNLVLHLANTLLLFHLLYRMTGAYWKSAAVAVVFAWHPMHVESVAWVAERKDVLSAFFFLLTLLAYVKYVKQFGVWSLKFKASEPGELHQQPLKFSVQGSGFNVFWWYGFALVFFALGLMAKPMLVTLPFVLLLLDYWPLRRAAQIGILSSKFKASNVPVANHVSRITFHVSHSALRLFSEKLPFFALSAASSIVTLIVQKRGGAVVPMEVLPMDERCFNALISYLRYAVKLFWPHDLSVIYPFTRESPSLWLVGAVIFLTATTWIAILVKKQAPYLVVGWLWYLGMLVPVIGLVQVGGQSMADRYAYLPSIGAFVAAVWGLAGLWRTVPVARVGLAGSFTIALAVLALLTRLQLGHWHDSVRLFQQATEVTRNNFVAHAILGNALMERKRLEEAMTEYRTALEIREDYVLAHENVGVCLWRMGRWEEAVAEYSRTLELWPGDAQAHYNLANANNPGYADSYAGRSATELHVDVDQAREHYRATLAIDPTMVNAHVNWGNLELSEGDQEAALTHYREALKIDPRSALTYFNLGNLYSTIGKTNDAIDCFSKAVEFDPGHAEAQFRLANLLARKRDFAAAVLHFRAALKSDPARWLCWNNLGGALAELGESDESVRCFDQAIAVNPEYPEAHVNKGKILARRGKLTEAAFQYSEAARLEPWNPEHCRNLGLVLDQLGDREAALCQFAAAAELKPFYPGAQDDLALAFVKIGKIEEAIVALRQALTLDPNWLPALNNLAWILATDDNSSVRNGTQAVALATRACELTGFMEPRLLGSLDAAYAEAGEFDKAIATAQKTRELALSFGQTNLVATANARLNLYRAGKPYRDAVARPQSKFSSVR